MDSKYIVELKELWVKYNVLEEYKEKIIGEINDGFPDGDLNEKQLSPLQIGRANKIINTPIKKLKKVSKRLSFRMSASILSYF